MDAALARLEDTEQRSDVAAVIAELRAHGGSPAHAPVALRACTALHTLTDSDAPAENRAEAAAAGAIEALLRTLRAHGADAAIQAQALWALSYILDAENVAEASRLGVVDAVLAALLAHVADADVQSAGFYALVRLLYFCSDNCIAACRAGAVDAALAALRIHNADVQVVAFASSLCHVLAGDNRSRAVVANQVGGCCAVSCRRYAPTRLKHGRARL
jgi:hypothetical protein